MKNGIKPRRKKIYKFNNTRPTKELQYTHTMLQMRTIGIQHSTARKAYSLAILLLVLHTPLLWIYNARNNILLWVLFIIMMP